MYYTGEDGSARAFTEEMTASGVVAEIRAEEGNLAYDYFFPADDPETVLLIDSWMQHLTYETKVEAEHSNEWLEPVDAADSNILK
ncbi:MAG: antibiotic biosynthesis monooxygenase [Bacteroidales bacterium]|nr:antibiotic biosynthesis monooxygenase [Bacteroidales bacterium]